VVSGKNERLGSWWRVTTGPITRNGIYDGETYDARLETPGWDAPGRPDDKFFPFAMLVEPPGGRLVAQSLEPIRVMETLEAQRIQQPRPGVYVFDFGQNLAGWGLLRLQGKRSRKVTLRFAESLYADGTVNQENLRTARATDEYILKGSGVEFWEPRFTYHGFRYVQMEGLAEPPTNDTLHARVVRSAVQPAGEFACSHPLLNRINEIVRWTEASNLHGLPTDCPQRDERMGWMNDLAARTEEAMCNFKLARLFAKFIADIADAQDARGAIPDTVPYRWGNRPADPVSVAFLLIPWQLYRWYGDRQVLADHFDAMRRWVDYLFSRAQENILPYSYYGDWAPPVAEAQPGGDGASPISRQTPGELVSTAYLHYHARLLAQIAAVLGRNTASESYLQRAAAVKVAYHQRFWDERAGGYGSNNQACNTLSLYMGLVPEDLRGCVLANLVNDVAAHGNHLTTGNLCTKYLLEVLSDMGRGDVAFRLATQTTYPSWGYMLENGATTVWERWEKATGGGMNSHNHPMLASVGSWLYKYVAGLDLEQDAIAFNRILIHPRVTDSLEWARAALETMQGRVYVAWHHEETGFTLDAQIPSNCRARLVIPLKAENWQLTEGGKILWQAGGIPQTIEGITRPTLAEGCINCEIRAGTYNFRLQSRGL
jgi:alpha-L-rhamnosidase